MNYGEEQRNELEALSEIYYNEIKVLSEKPLISFSIKIHPQASNYEELVNSKSDEDDEDDDDDDGDYDEEDPDNQVETFFGGSPQDLCVELQFELPSKYPDEKPHIQILNSQNLDVHELSELLDILNSKAEESLGTVMTLTLVSDVVEWLVTKSEKEAVEVEQEKERKQKEVEAEEKKRFDGTPVTEQTFLRWKAKFDAEMLKAKLEYQKLQAEQSGGSVRRLTGREMFESDKTLAESDLNFVEDLDQNQIEALLHNIEELDIEDGDEFNVGEDEDLDFEDDDDEDDEEDSDT